MARQTQTHRTSRKQSERGETPSVFTCPDCQGTLFVSNSNGLTRFRCRIGHMYSPESMMDAQDENVERLMWSAVRALSEQAEYLARLSQGDRSGDGDLRRQYAGKSRAAEHSAGILRRLITRGTEEKAARLSRRARTPAHSRQRR
jgi:two-component system chemotaxis response regulator CheB